MDSTRAAGRGLALVLAGTGVAGCAAGGSGVTRSSNAVVRDVPSGSAAPDGALGSSAHRGSDTVFSASVATGPSSVAGLRATVLSDRPGGDALTSVSGPPGIRARLRPAPLALPYERPVVIGAGAGVPEVTLSGLPAQQQTVTLRLHFQRGGVLVVTVPVRRTA